MAEAEEGQGGLVMIVSLNFAIWHPIIGNSLPGTGGGEVGFSEGTRGGGTGRDSRGGAGAESARVVSCDIWKFRINVMPYH